MQSRSKKVFFTALLIWFYGWFFITRFASSKQITLVTIVQAVYSFFTLCLSYSPPWGSVALLLYWCAFWKYFLSLQLDLVLRLRLEWCSSPIDILVSVVDFMRIKPWILSQELEQAIRKRTTICSSLDLHEIDSEQLAVGCKMSMSSLHYSVYISSIKAGQKHLESPFFPWSSNITFRRPRCQHIIY